MELEKPRASEHRNGRLVDRLELFDDVEIEVDTDIDETVRLAVLDNFQPFQTDCIGLVCQLHARCKSPFAASSILTPT